MIPKINSSRGVQLLDIEPEELARQLALFEANLYNRILPVDCLDTAWSRSNPENGANIKAMINTSNRMAAWVAQAILIHIDAKKRAQVMKYFLQVADVSSSSRVFA
jgi:son of sevenless-like protein